MTNMLRLRRWAGLTAVAGVGLLLATVIATRGATPGPVVTAADAELVQVELTAQRDSGAIDSTRAVAAARDFLPVMRDRATTVLTGRASAYPGGETRDVWVVVVDGGRPPSLGPVGNDGSTATSGASRLTGVLVDQLTGEVLRGFVIGEAPKP